MQQAMFKVQKGSKDIVKIVHVTSVVQPSFYEATRILFLHKEKQQSKLKYKDNKLNNPA